MNWRSATLFVIITAAVAQNDDSDAEIVNVPEKAPPPPPGPLDDCDPDMIGFELVTGYVFSAPGNVLDSIPGTLMLTDCLETCQGNDSCRSVNYETGLCILFSSNADALPGKMCFYIHMYLLFCLIINDLLFIQYNVLVIKVYCSKKKILRKIRE